MILVFFVLVALISGCTQEKQPITIENGLYGYVSLKEGDCMPVIGPDEDRCKESNVSVDLYFKEFVDGFYAGEILTLEEMESIDLIEGIKSDVNGFYEVKLLPGNYLAFSEIDGRYYCHGKVSVGKGVEEKNLLINRAVH